MFLSALDGKMQNWGFREGTDGGLCRHVVLTLYSLTLAFGIESCSNQGLLGELDISELLASSHHVLVLDTHDTTAPLSVELSIIIVLDLELGAELFEVDEVFSANISKGDAGSRLQMDELAKVSLATDEAEGHTLLSAESGQMHNELDGINVVGDDDELGLVLFNKGGHVVQAKLEVHGLLSLFSGSRGGSTGLSLMLESSGFLLVGLRRVLGEQFKELGSCIS